MSRTTGDKINLTTPQLRVYLDSMKRLAEAHSDRGDIQRNAGDPHCLASLGRVIGISEAIKELLKALGLPPDWAAEMDRLEAEEARRGPE